MLRLHGLQLKARDEDFSLIVLTKYLPKRQCNRGLIILDQQRGASSVKPGYYAVGHGQALGNIPIWQPLQACPRPAGEEAAPCPVRLTLQRWTTRACGAASLAITVRAATH